MGVLNVTRCLGWLTGLMEAGPHPPQKWEDGGLSPVNTGANGKYFGSLELSQAGTLGERGCPRNEALSCLSAMLKFVQIILCGESRGAGVDLFVLRVCSLHRPWSRPAEKRVQRSPSLIRERAGQRDSQI